MRKAARSLYVLLTALTAAVPTAAEAAIECKDPSATLQLPSGSAGEAISSGDFSVIAWIRPSEIATRCNILDVGNSLSIHLLESGAVRGCLQAFDDKQLCATTDIVFDQANQWALLALTYDAAEGSLTLWARSETIETVSTNEVDETHRFGQVGDMTVGAANEVAAMVGCYGLMVVRNHNITGADVDSLWQHGRHHSPYSLDTRSAGGMLNGPQGCVWMINHALTTSPLHINAGGQPHEWAAVVDQPVSCFNVHVYDIAGEQGDSLRAVRDVLSTQGFVYRSPYDFPAIGEQRFFTRTLPDTKDNFPGPPHYVSRVSPRARLLATPLPKGIGLVRVLASANSRGVLAGDGSAAGTGNFVHGFLWNNLDRTAGVINRPARLSPGPWFGFDASQSNPHATGDITELRYTDFSRFWTSAVNTSSIGPGDGLHLHPGATYTLRCQPQGMITTDQPLLVQAHVLRFPGASNVHWSPNKHDEQSGAGTTLPGGGTVSLDTLRWAHEMNAAAGDAMTSPKQLTLAGDHTQLIAQNDACYVSGGSISVISSVNFNGEATVIEFQHPFSEAPSDGSMLRFGPWEMTTIWYRWPSLENADPNVWRGLALEAGQGDGVVVFSFDAWRPGVDGFVFGIAGWGGLGYEQQLARSFAGTTSAWASRLGVDVWLQMFATQVSHPNSMNAYTQQIRAGVPDVEVVWLGDVEHLSSWDTELWHWWALTQAQANNVVSSTLLVHEDLGSQLDLLGDGLRSDMLHLSQRGNQRLATLWTQALLDAAIEGPLPKRSDLDGDDNVNVADLLSLLGSWGACENANTCPADLDDDGTVNVQDLLLLLSDWGS